MLLGIERDLVKMLKTEKQSIFVKAKSKIMVMRENHISNLESIEKIYKEKIEALGKLES